MKVKMKTRTEDRFMVSPFTRIGYGGCQRNSLAKALTTSIPWRLIPFGQTLKIRGVKVSRSELGFNGI